jgi:hypothetical protein
MKKTLIFLAFLALCSCTKKADDSLIIPPNFAEMPDPKNPEKPKKEQGEENIAKLKELLLKSEE